MEEEQTAQMEGDVMPFMAKHFWLFYIGSLLFAIMLSYHHIVNILPNPVIANGVTTRLQKTYETKFYNRRGGFTESLYARKIKFKWQNRNYEIIGGWDEEMDGGVPVKVVFNKGQPEQAQELSLPGLLDFSVLRWAIPAWIIFSGYFYAFAYADEHFTAFNFRVPKLTYKSFASLLIILLFIPLYPVTDLILFGKKTEGIMGDEADYVNGSYLRPIVFKAAGVSYSAYSQYADDYEKKTGNRFSIIYRPDNPNRCCLFQAGALYSNNYTILMGIALILLTGWLYGSYIQHLRLFNGAKHS